jgi:2',3'-cyclic-nucleotide 2'-phosphodiesterase (5'-nucleotidase family)
MGNWIADLVYTEYPVCDVVLLNGGTLRNNCVIPPGHITLKTVSQMLPMPDRVVQLNVPGKTILRALENSVSQYPKFEGRFAAVAGINFTWDAKRDPGSRIVSN